MWEWHGIYLKMTCKKECKRMTCKNDMQSILTWHVQYDDV